MPPETWSLVVCSNKTAVFEYRNWPKAVPHMEWRLGLEFTRS
jgi:hypothetical protein